MFLPYVRLPACLRALAGCLLLCLASAGAEATTILSVGTGDLADRSSYIFHGRVVDRWVAGGTKPDAIYTFVRFAVDDVLKGSAGHRTVVLRFLGGTLNGRTLRVEGMQIPKIGEEGVYFVEDLARNHVQPFYGWDQGRFVVLSDAAGRRTVFTHDRRPVGRVDIARTANGIGDGLTDGIVVASTNANALTLDAFKAQIRNMVEARQ